MYYFVLDKIQVNRNQIDAINKALIHIYIILLCIVGLIMLQLTSSC